MTRLFRRPAALVLALAGGSALAQGPPPAPRPGVILVPPAVVQASGPVEILARGPVHEAFAEPVDGRSLVTPVVPLPPPLPVDELPPSNRPAGDEVVWIGGYWHWDDERNDHVWVAGCWRNEPPGRTWLPGQWVPVKNGFHWVSGAWVPEGVSEISLLPAPPPPVEEDLDGLQPTNGTSVLVPGHWVWKGNRYAWRSTRFVAEPADYVWQPATYTWTPGGYLFVDGYWDRPLRQRGLLFAPASFRRDSVTARPGVYAPVFAVHPDFLEAALFVRPAGKHYYFGDYFDAGYRARGVIPWPEYRTATGGLDPLFAHYRTYAPVANWEGQLAAVYAARAAGKAPRPARTLALQDQYVRTVVKTAGPGFVPPPAVRVNAPLIAVNVIGQTGVQVRAVEQGQRDQYRRHAQEQAKAAEQYRAQQAQIVTQQGGAAAAPKAPVTVKLAVKTARPAYLAPRAQGAPPPPPDSRAPRP